MTSVKHFCTTLLQLNMNTLSVHTYRFNFGVDLPKILWIEVEKTKQIMLFLVTTLKKPDSPSLLSTRSCKCKKRRTLAFISWKAGINYSTIFMGSSLPLPPKKNLYLSKSYLSENSTEPNSTKFEVSTVYTTRNRFKMRKFVKMSSQKGH